MDQVEDDDDFALAPRKRADFSEDDHNETPFLAKPIEAALNAMPGVWASRNAIYKKCPVAYTLGDGTVKKMRTTFGLGDGSADIVAEVACLCAIDEQRQSLPAGSPEHAAWCVRGFGVIAHVTRIAWLEVKWPGKALRPTQRDWHASHRVRVPGTFITVVHSVEEAVAAIGRCRAGEVA